MTASLAAKTGEVSASQAWRMVLVFIVSAYIIKEGESHGRPVVRNGGAVRRPVAGPRPILFLAAEWIVARASPSPTRDAFATGDSKPSRKRGCDEARLHGTRSRGPGTPAEWNQSPAPRRLAARVSAAWTELRGCPCLAPVIGSPGQRWHHDRAAGSAAVGRREMPLAVAVPSTPRSGARSH